MLMDLWQHPFFKFLKYLGHPFFIISQIEKKMVMEPEKVI